MKMKTSNIGFESGNGRASGFMCGPRAAKPLAFIMLAVYALFAAECTCKIFHSGKTAIKSAPEFRTTVNLRDLGPFGEVAK